MSEVEFPKKMKQGDLKAIVGLYVVQWRNRRKQVVKIVGTETDGKVTKAVYDIITEPDKGCRCSAKYDPSQEVMVYDENTLALALLEK